MRRHLRLPFEAPLQVSWKDSRGRVQSAKGKCLDISAEGAQIEMAVPLAARTGITLSCEHYGSLGTATVRYCSRKTLQYAIGVEFTASLSLACEARRRCLGDRQSPGCQE